MIIEGKSEHNEKNSQKAAQRSQLIMFFAPLHKVLEDMYQGYFLSMRRYASSLKIDPLPNCNQDQFSISKQYNFAGNVSQFVLWHKCIFIRNEPAGDMTYRSRIDQSMHVA